VLVFYHCQVQLSSYRVPFGHKKTFPQRERFCFAPCGLPLGRAGFGTTQDLQNAEEEVDGIQGDCSSGVNGVVHSERKRECARPVIGDVECEDADTDPGEDGHVNCRFKSESDEDNLSEGREDEQCQTGEKVGTETNEDVREHNPNDGHGDDDTARDEDGLQNNGNLVGCNHGSNHQAG